MQIAIVASNEILSAIGRLGRTEDVHFSPDNRRLAIAGMMQNRILVLDIDLAAGAQGRILLTDYLELTSPSFKHLHGLFWIDEQTLIVANRGGAVSIVTVPAEKPATRLVDLTPLTTIGTDEIGLLQTPGSVSVATLGLDLFEVLVCNNSGHYVSRHILDARSDFSAVGNDIFSKDGLNIPDGVAYSRSARWIAVSNHYDHSVFLYKNDAGLTQHGKPSGVLRGVNYPHGVRFTTDERFILVADAGAPFVHVYASEDGDWRGERDPAAALHVIDDDAFARGHHNPEEGGPKGIDVSFDGGVLVATCEEEPIVFFDIRETLKTASHGIGHQPAGGHGQLDAELTRSALLRHLAASQGALREARTDNQFARNELRNAQQRAEALTQDLQAMLGSRSWRATTPLRWLTTAVRGSRQVLRPRSRS